MGSNYAGNKGLEYYKAYPRDFFEGTLGMAGPLRGFYRMVIDLIYMHDGFLLSDFGHISGHTGFGKTQCKRMMQKLVDSDKIQLSGKNGEYFTQKRAKNELKDSRKFQENQANKAAKRWNNNSLDDAVALPDGIPPQDHKTTRPQDNVVVVRSDKKNDAQTFREKLIEACKMDEITVTGVSNIGPAQMRIVESWVNQLGLSEAEILEVITDAMRSKEKGEIKSVKYFEQQMANFAAAKNNKPPEGKVNHGANRPNYDNQRIANLAGAGASFTG